MESLFKYSIPLGHLSSSTSRNSQLPRLRLFHCCLIVYWLFSCFSINSVQSTLTISNITTTNQSVIVQTTGNRSPYSKVFLTASNLDGKENDTVKSFDGYPGTYTISGLKPATWYTIGLKSEFSGIVDNAQGQAVMTSYSDGSKQDLVKSLISYTVSRTNDVLQFDVSSKMASTLNMVLQLAARCEDGVRTRTIKLNKTQPSVIVKIDKNGEDTTPTVLVNNSTAALTCPSLNYDLFLYSKGGSYKAFNETIDTDKAVAAALIAEKGLKMYDSAETTKTSKMFLITAALLVFVFAVI